MARINMHISKVKLPFYPSCEVKCRLLNWVSTFHCLKYIMEHLNLIIIKSILKALKNEKKESVDE